MIVVTSASKPPSTPPLARIATLHVRNIAVKGFSVKETPPAAAGKTSPSVFRFIRYRERLFPPERKRLRQTGRPCQAYNCMLKQIRECYLCQETATTPTTCQKMIGISFLPRKSLACGRLPRSHQGVSPLHPSHRFDIIKH